MDWYLIRRDKDGTCDIARFVNKEDAEDVKEYFKLKFPNYTWIVIKK